MICHDYIHIDHHHMVEEEASGVITSVCVTHFPHDTTEREFQNYFALTEGFKCSSLKTIGSHSRLMGFALFETPEQAEWVAEHLDGKVCATQGVCNTMMVRCVQHNDGKVCAT